MTQRRPLQSTSVDDTIAIGSAIGAALAAGDVIALVGTLGAGKTHFVKGVAEGLGLTNRRRVNSPTFVLVNEYDARLHVYHLDAYRLSAADEFEALGFEEMCESGGVVIVEWADKVAEAFPAEALWIEFDVLGDTLRRLTLCLPDSPLAERLQSAGLDRWTASP